MSKIKIILLSFVLVAGCLTRDDYIKVYTYQGYQMAEVMSLNNPGLLGICFLKDPNGKGLVYVSYLANKQAQELWRNFFDTLKAGQSVTIFLDRYNAEFFSGSHRYAGSHS